MPTKMCGICEKLFDVTPKSWLEVPFTMSYLCSARCVYAWIKMQSAARLDFALKGASLILENQVLSEPSDAYSRKLNTFYRSQFERVFAEACAVQGLQTFYETMCFAVGNGSYTPDFYFPDYGCFVEIKGQWGIGQKSKMRKFIEQHPMIPIVLVPWSLRKEFGYEGQKYGDYIQ